MEMNKTFKTPKELGWFGEALEYGFDALQRGVLFLDVLRQRGNMYIEHKGKGQPPVLTFDYKIIIDGRSLERPVNHDLALILPEKGVYIDHGKRPIVIIDPRAGHGPGIGGSKIDSEIGMALRNGHPVYFIIFYPKPCPGQTLEDVRNAQASYIEEVKRRHPNAEEPAVIGNCQAGWAVALLSASRPDLTGPVVLNGSPLSYWAGVDGQNPMRYRGGLLGGIWLTDLLGDLGNGTFDGANLVANFEDLNPANTYWTKQYHLWANIDTEGERYLNFEKWWNGYFYMTAEEILFIVENLFIGNKLEKGTLEVTKGEKIDLKNLDDPILVFASKGDNITPPQQALNWIAKVYQSVDEIKRNNQVIIYRIHEKIGHLGIFVSGSVAKKEHKEIIENIDMIDFLPPGLYEMVIDEQKKKMNVTDYNVRFEERDIVDILAYDDGLEDEEDFAVVAAVSEFNDRLYQTMMKPWVKLFSTEYSARMMRHLHPLRFSRYIFSDQNPFVFPVKYWVPLTREYRRPAAKDNLFFELENHFSDMMVGMLDAYRDIRDASSEFYFKMIYGNPVVKSIFSETVTEAEKRKEERKEARKQIGAERTDKEHWSGRMDEGGFPEAIVRTILAIAGADKIIDQREYEIAEKLIKAHKKLQKLQPAEVKTMVKNQARILNSDPEKALQALAGMLPSEAERKEALTIACDVASADLIVVEEEKVMLNKIKKYLGLEE